MPAAYSAALYMKGAIIMLSQIFKEDFYKDWNYKKHALFCTAVYLGLYTFDMTVSYLIVKPLMNKMQKPKAK